VLEERKKKNETKQDPNRKLDSDEEPSPKAYQRVEKAVKIQVGESP
jgi:hypothetical protein